MTLHHHFVADETLDGAWLCSACDRPRPGPLAYCPDCAEVTESYLWSDDGPAWERDIAPASLVYARQKEWASLDALRAGSLGLAPVVRCGKAVGA